MAEYTIGDVVVLKSGGPKMTITNPRYSQGNIETTWFAGSKKERGVFPEEAIERPPSESKK